LPATADRYCGALNPFTKTVGDADAGAAPPDAAVAVEDSAAADLSGTVVDAGPVTACGPEADAVIDTGMGGGGGIKRSPLRDTPLVDVIPGGAGIGTSATWVGAAVATGDAVPLGEALGLGDAVLVGEATSAATGIGTQNSARPIRTVSGCAPRVPFLLIPSSKFQRAKLNSEKQFSSYEILENASAI